MTTAKLIFGEWTPDQPGVAGTVTDAVNCYPVANGYGPLNSIEAYPNANTSASENLLIAFGGKFGGQNNLFTAGSTKIFKFNSDTNAFDDVSKVGGYSATQWDITQYGPTMIAANGLDKLQAYNLASSSLFADLSADAPIAKYVTVVRDFVVAANVASEESTVYWSDLNNEANWTPSSTSQADSQVLPDGGDVTGLAGGEYGLVFLERAIYRMTYSGSPFFFQFDAISRSIGCISNGSIAQLGEKTYFLADDGFYVCDGQSVTPIGAEKVNRWFFENAAANEIATNMSASIDPIRSLVMWVMPTSSGKLLLIYNTQTNKFSYSTTQLNSIAYVLTSSSSIESLDRISITAGTNTLAATYTRTLTTVTVTATNHKLETNAYVYFDATSGGAADGYYQIVKVSDNSFTFSTVASGSISSSSCILSLPSIDVLSASMDDRAYAGGSWFLAGVYGAQVYGFTGIHQDAYITSNDLDFGRSIINLAKPIVDNGSADVAVSSRAMLNESNVFSNYVSADSENRVSLRSNGYYHRIKVRPTGSDWKTIVGVNIDYSQQGGR